MSWVCEYCSSCNDDSLSVCMICDSPRSLASIRAAKREARERARKKREESLYKIANRSARILTLVSIAVFLVFGTVSLILKILGGSIGDIVISGIGIIEHFADRLTSVISVGCVGVVKQLCASDAASVYDNLCAVGDFLADKPSFVTTSLLDGVGAAVLPKLADLSFAARTVADTCAYTFVSCMDALGQPVSHIAQKALSAADSITYMIDNAKENIMQFKN